MLCTKAENPFANSTPAEGKATAVGHLCTRKNLPTAAPLPELLNNKTQKSCTLIYAVQSTAGLEKSCQHTSSFWAGSPRGLWQVISLSMHIAVLPTMGSHPWQWLGALHKQHHQVFLQMPGPHHLYHDDNTVWGQVQWEQMLSVRWRWVAGIWRIKQNDPCGMGGRSWLMLRGSDCMK